MIRRRDALGRLSVLAGVAALGSRSFADAIAQPMILSVDGPLVVTNNILRQRELFEGVFGLSLVADQELDALSVKALFEIGRAHV